MILSNLTLRGSNGFFYRVLDYVSTSFISLGELEDTINVDILDSHIAQSVKVGIIKNTLGKFYVPLNDNENYVLLQEKLTNVLFVFPAKKLFSENKACESNFVLHVVNNEIDTEINTDAELLSLQKKLYVQHRQASDMKSKVLTSVFGSGVKLSYSI